MALVLYSLILYRDVLTLVLGTRCGTNYSPVNTMRYLEVRTQVNHGFIECGVLSLFRCAQVCDSFITIYMAVVLTCNTCRSA
jgi:hypothetical protein